jgi:hypothetical protein
MNTTYRISENETIWIITDNQDGTSSITEVVKEAPDYDYWYQLATQNND